MPISTNKHVLAYKIKPNFKDAYDAFKEEWALRILLETYFSPINDDYQKWLDKQIINDYFGYELEFNLDYANILFFIENDDAKVLPKLIKESLNKKLLTKETVEQIKHRYIGMMFEIFSDVESFNNGYIRDLLSGLDYFEALKILKSIKLEDVEKSMIYLSCPHTSYISMIKK